MKKVIALSLFIFLCSSIHIVNAQQIANGDVEYWSFISDSNKEFPIGWTTRNHFDENPQAIYCVKVDESYSGHYAVMLQNFQPSPNTSLASFLSLGGYDAAKPKQKGIAFNGRPLSLNFAYKYFTTKPNPTGFFQSKALLRLVRWDEDNETSVLVGSAEFSIIHKTNTYIVVEEEIDYFENSIPDSLYLTFTTPSNPDDQIRLTLDDIYLEFAGTTGISEPFYFDKIRLFPNPASTVINVFNPVIDTNSQLLIYDSLGRLQGQHDLSESNQEIDIASLDSGFYFYQIRTEDELVKTGKFLKSDI